jgi:hypothetical protein
MAGDASIGGHMNLQQFGIRIGVYVSTGLCIEKLAKVVGVDKISIDRHGHAVGTVDEEGLGLGSGWAR